MRSPTPHDLALGRLAACLALVALAGGCGQARARAVDVVVGVGTVTPAEVARRLERGGERELLVVDVRDGARFRRGHVPGAHAVALGDLEGFLERAPVPRDRLVVAVCERGVSSREAAAIARGLGYRHAASLAGGMSAWRAGEFETETGGGDAALDAAPGPAGALRPTLFEQSVIVLGAFVMKPAHMLIMLLVIVALRRRRERELRLVRAAMVAFLAGEAICAVNYALTGGLSDRLELAHGLGMVAMGALLPWGLFALVDRRVLGLTEPDARCAALRLCGRCWKRDDVSCAAHRVFEAVAPCLALTALVPLAAPLSPRRVALEVFGTETVWSRSLVQLLVEQRLYPALALVSLSTAAALLLAGPSAVKRAEFPFFVGFGLLAFSLVRFFLAHAFPEMPAWADVFEELTELLAVASVAFVLVVLREQLGLVNRTPADGGGDDAAA